jgi:hypothetical protein
VDVARLPVLMTRLREMAEAQRAQAAPTGPARRAIAYLRRMDVLNLHEAADILEALHEECRPRSAREMRAGACSLTLRGVIAEAWAATTRRLRGAGAKAADERPAPVRASGLATASART